MVLCAASFVNADNCSINYKATQPGYDFTANLERCSDDAVQSIPSTVKIRNIHINRLPIFNIADPEEDKLLYRWANKFHTTTRTSVISDLLLIEE